MEGGTFHSFAFRQIKRYSRVLGLPSSFGVLDEGDAEEAIHRCASRLAVYEKEKKRFPKKETLRALISMSVNQRLPLGDVVRREYPHFAEYIPEIETIRREYTAFKVSRAYLDYDDLLVYLRILLDDAGVRERMADRFRYIMVDEYQDTNAIQGEIACLLADRHRNIMVVGDDAQSIYGFRGTSHKNIMEFPERFPGTLVIKLEENYRSTQAILDLANAILEDMKESYSKCLVSAHKIEGEMPRLLQFKDPYDEAEWVAESIKQGLDEGIPLHHHCVLFRSLYLSIPLQSELARRDIPYETFGGLKFYETAHVKDLMAHLKVIANPRDELSWNRVLMMIPQIGPKTAERLIEAFSPLPSLEEIIEKGFPPFLRAGWGVREGA